MMHGQPNINTIHSLYPVSSINDISKIFLHLYQQNNLFL